MQFLLLNSSINSHNFLIVMFASLIIALLWVSGGLAIHTALPTWILVLYLLISTVGFLAWIIVRTGALGVQED